MTENPELTVKSDYLAGILQRVFDYERLTPAQQKKYYDDKTTQQNGEYLIGTFVLDLLRCGYRAGAALDLSCATVKSLPLALGRSLREDTAVGKDLQTAAEGVAKGLAAYLFALGMNEHDTRLTVTMKRTAFTKPDPDEGPLWAECMRITTGLKREKDFLIPALEGGSGNYHGGKGVMLLNVAPAIRAYKAAFGVDLSQYGLVDMALEADVKE